MSRQYEIEFEPNRQLEINFKEKNMIYDEKMYATEQTRTPRKDMRIGKWVVGYYDKGKFKEEEFISDADAWIYYYQIFNQKKAEFLRNQKKR